MENDSFNCECGGKYKYEHMDPHFNTKKHRKYLTDNGCYSKMEKYRRLIKIKEICKFIKKRITEQIYNNHLRDYIGPIDMTYFEFLKFQNDYLTNSSDIKLEFYDQLRKSIKLNKLTSITKCISIDKTYYYTSDCFYFNQNEQIIILQPFLLP